METNAENDEESDKNRFKTVHQPEKDNIMDGRIRENTKKATDCWMRCLNDYLKEKKLPKVDNIETKDLPQILSDFYTELRKVDCEGEYKTSTLKCIRAAINRYFKEKRSLDILQDQRFIQSNEMFKGVTRKAKAEGRGEVESRPPIEPEDMKKISAYFEANLEGPPNPRKLQEIVLFYIIYYMCRRGRQNLRNMKKSTFAIGADPTGREYIYQAVKESDKNHKEDDTSPNNQARVYSIPGKNTSKSKATVYLRANKQIIK